MLNVWVMHIKNMCMHKPESVVKVNDLYTVFNSRLCDILLSSLTPSCHKFAYKWFNLGSPWTAKTLRNLVLYNRN